MRSLEAKTHIADLFDQSLAVCARRLVAVIPYFRIPFIGQYLDGGAFLKRKVDLFGSRVLKDKGDGHTVVDNMIQLNKKENQKLDDRRLTGNVLTLHIAGSDTTAHTMSWMLYELAKDSVLRHEAVNEARTLGDHQKTFADVLHAVPLLRSLFWETLRLRGPVGMTALENNSPIDVAGVTIDPYEYNIMIPFRYLATKCSGPTFDPRRWLTNDRSTLKPIPSAIMPFGFGVRICPARDLAELEACFGVAKLLVAYPNLTLADPSDVEPPRFIFNFTMTTDRPIRLSFLP